MPLYCIPAQPADLFACWGTGWMSRLISYGTSVLIGPRGLRISPSHVAIAAVHDRRVVWWESTSLCPHPCLFTGAPVDGVQAHEIDTRVNDYLSEGGRVVQYRLVPLYTLGADDRALLSELLSGLCGLSYDRAGAILSGTRIISRTRWMPPADLDRLFCSELVAALLSRLGRAPHLHPGTLSPGRLLRLLVRLGIYREVARWSA